jgi:hypothetical protein
LHFSSVWKDRRSNVAIIDNFDPCIKRDFMLLFQQYRGRDGRLESQIDSAVGLLQISMSFSVLR